MNTRNIVKNIRSKELNGNGPKLPTSGQLDYGEIAVNYKKGYETLSLKNDNNEIVSLSVNTVNDVTVNGTSVVSDKTAGITMKGETIPVADAYEPTVYPSPFESKAEHISASDKVDKALKKVETNISKLVSEVVKVPSDAISKLAKSAGTIDGSNNITYVKATNAQYISNATSVHDATVKLDSNLYSLDIYCQNLNNTVINLERQINSLQSTVNSLQMEYVNLGLPSGLQWAKCNIGAATETDYGDYFMWGSTTPDNNHTCNWANTPFNNGTDTYNGTYFTDDVKNTLCPNGVLAKEFDAAYKATKGIGRMPTEAEFLELFDKTDNRWVKNFKGTGVNGWEFTSKTDTNKYIFIPASGYRTDSSLKSQGETGDIWTSSLYTPDQAYNSNFTKDGQSMDYSGRYRGFTVRAVRK